MRLEPYMVMMVETTVTKSGDVGHIPMESEFIQKKISKGGGRMSLGI